MIIIITITPQGSVYLCKTPLENDYKNQLTFANATSQLNYFNGKVVTSETDYTYMKKDNQIIVGKPIDTIISCNYLFYKNTGFTNKYYYCFITNMEYVNENATRITIETDVYQTYMFDIVKKRCFVEREHVNDDTIGKNIVPEDLFCGDYVVSNYIERGIFADGNRGYIIIGLSTLVENFPTPSSNVYNGVYSGLTYYILEDATKATEFIKALMEAWGYDAAASIYCLFMIPREMVTASAITWSSGTIGDNTLSFGILPSGLDIVTLGSYTLSVGTTLNKYTPVNKKLLTSPFNYILATNNCGQSADYKFEDFLDGNGHFSIIGAITVGCSIRMDPTQYKNGFYDEDDPSSIIDNRRFKSYGLTCGKFPTCSWNCDSYTNWLTANAVNMAVETASKLSMSALGFATGNTVMGTMSALDAVTNLMSYGSEEEKMPNQAKGNVNSGDILFSSASLGFSFYRMTIKASVAKRIDDYFSMYGYRVNEVKIPNLIGRTNWNYVKTIDCNFEGDIPQEYLNKIKEMFNNGVTLWHNPSTFLDYSQSNSIVS